MRPDLAFDFAKKKQMHCNPICWTSCPEDLSEKLDDKSFSA
jgi:hypothetical protein